MHGLVKDVIFRRVLGDLVLKVPNPLPQALQATTGDERGASFHRQRPDKRHLPLILNGESLAKPVRVVLGRCLVAWHVSAKVRPTERGLKLPRYQLLIVPTAAVGAFPHVHLSCSVPHTDMAERYGRDAGDRM